MRPFSLRFRIYLALGLLMAVTVGGGAFMIWYGTRLETFFTGIFERQVHALEAAMRLENSLAAQRGFLTYYSLDHDPNWLKLLSENLANFDQELGRVRSFAGEPRARQILNEIESGFARLGAERERVVELLDSGDRAKASVVHAGARRRYEALMAQCDLFLGELRAELERDREDGIGRLRLVNGLAMAFLPFSLLMGVVLAVVLSRQILAPIRRLAQGMDEAVALGPDEVSALENRVHGLINRVGQAKAKLEKSQANLMAAERLATVGRMAAGVAHSIRNPLTSVKMRLFSLERSLALTEVQKEDFEVISQEIKHLDAIIQHFLEYARPPKLKLGRASPSAVVDGAVTLLRHRFETQRVAVTVEREKPLMPILLDPEQLKEVLVNLLANALDAMDGPGSITISEEDGFIEPKGRVAVIAIADSGPGVEESKRDQVFEPFFTTKEEGTGLGLPIARRIVEGHGGTISLTQAKGGGAKFTLTLPFDAEVQGGARWH